MKRSALIKDMLPPALWRFGNRVTGRSTAFVGTPGNWAEALRASSGYADDLILQRVADATRAVLAGRAAFERDSVLFMEPEFPFELLAPLLRSAVSNGGRLEVIDFGGSLGSTYRQCRPFLPTLSLLKWHIIEQDLFARAGQKEFTTAELDFHTATDSLPPPQARRIVLASSVLQYLENPYEQLSRLSALDAGMLVVDRTPYSEEADDHLCVQRVPRSIYESSYPCWVFSRRRFLEYLAPTWRLLAEFGSDEGVQFAEGGRRFEFKGMILEKKA